MPVTLLPQEQRALGCGAAQSLAHSRCGRTFCPPENAGMAQGWLKSPCHPVSAFHGMLPALPPSFSESRMVLPTLREPRGWGGDATCWKALAFLRTEGRVSEAMSQQAGREGPPSQGPRCRGEEMPLSREFQKTAVQLATRPASRGPTAGAGAVRAGPVTRVPLCTCSCGYGRPDSGLQRHAYLASELPGISRPRECGQGFSFLFLVIAGQPATHLFLFNVFSSQ